MAVKIKFQFPDGTECSYPAGTALRQIAAEFQPKFSSTITAIKLNNQIHDLNFIPVEGGKLTLIDLTYEDGVRIYSRSLSLVFLRAASELLPNYKVRIEHSLSKGLYGELECVDNQPFSEKELRGIADRMRKIIENDEPILKETIPVTKAIEFFQTTGQHDKVRLLRYKKKPEIHIYHCGKYTDYLYGYMLPSTGYLKKFDLKFYLPGFILRFPVTESPSMVPEYKEHRKLAGIYYEFEKWGRIMEVGDVGAFNDLVDQGRGGELIRIAEAFHEKKIAQIADRITTDSERIRVILIAGPSSSGKTTFAQRLAVQLLVNELRPVSISIDNYFVDREHTPLGPDGLPDYECIEAIDLELFNEHLTSLVQGVPVNLPIYNFQKGTREPFTKSLQIKKDQPVIIEGIHGLNNKLTSNIPKTNKFKIYISALTQLNIDDHNRIPTTDNRIIRRIVRDHLFRGHEAIRTIGLWPMVRRGEDAYIFPYQEEADLMFNSALIYELAVLKNYAEPLLNPFTPDLPEYSEAKRLLKFLDYFLPLDDREVPLNSILREFIGSSCFR